MPRGEIPNGIDDSHGGQFEQQVATFRPRTPLDGLVERVARGANPHALIGAELKNDAAILRQYNRDLLHVGISPIDNLVDEMAELYDLTPKDTEGIDSRQLLGDLIFVSGFSYLAVHIHPKLVIASEQSRQGSFDRLAEEMMSAPESTRAIFAAQVDRDSRFRDLVSGEINRVLERYPSGVAWLQTATQTELGNSPKEFAGATKAITGAGKLYQFLRP